MVGKLFILGRPGSGKSTAARHILKYLKSMDLTSFRINDYEFLKEMFEDDTNQKRFRSVGYGGFDVLDPVVFDNALEDVRHQAVECCKSDKYDLVTIEFARSDYSVALQRFDLEFLHDAYFLFIDADLATCVERVRNRVINPQTSDDTYFSEETLKHLYSRDNRLYMSISFANEYELLNRQVRIIDNTGSKRKFEESVIDFVEFILKKNLNKLPDTDSIQVTLKSKVTGGEIEK